MSSLDMKIGTFYCRGGVGSEFDISKYQTDNVNKCCGEPDLQKALPYVNCVLSQHFLFCMPRNRVHKELCLLLIWFS